MTTQRYLTSQEKEWICDWLKPNKNIPKACAQAQVDSIKQDIMEQCETIMLYPSRIPQLKRSIERQFYISRISPGEMVGVSCAQSIGEKQTQSALNSFHHIGVTAKLVTTGTPRMNELLNLTHNPVEKTTFITFNKKYDTISDIRKILGSSLVALNFSDVTLGNPTIIYKEKSDTKQWMPSWVKAWCLMKQIECQDTVWCFEYDLKYDVLYRNSLTYEKVSKILQGIYVTITAIPSPNLQHKLRLYVKPIQKNIDEHELVAKYIQELNNTHLTGIQGITDIYYTKKNGSWCVETDGVNLDGILGHPLVNTQDTYSNYVWEIYDTLGIEAARSYLIEEFMSLMTGINYAHVKILCDRMTWSGSLDSISRYTMRKDQNPLLRCSFEECMHNFVSAATQCEKDFSQGISSSIILGKRAKAGSGFVDLAMKHT